MLPWPYPKVVAHRGGGMMVPENTMAAMQYAALHGFKGVEFDVMLSRDHHPVLMHDWQLGRTVTGTGSVATYTAAQLHTFDAGAWFDAQFVGESVPAYADIALYCRTQNIWMNVEIKPVPGFEAITGQVVANRSAQLFQDLLSDVSDSVLDPRIPLLSSFSIEALIAAKATVPKLARGLLVDVVPNDWQEQCSAIEAKALHVNQAHLTEATADAIKKSGLWLFCYTVNEIERGQTLLAWGVDGFCTDRVDLILPNFAQTF